MDGFSTIVNALGATRPQPASERFATFGAVHLNVTSIERAIGFWTRIGGMKLRPCAFNTPTEGRPSRCQTVLPWPSVPAG